MFAAGVCCESVCLTCSKGRVMCVSACAWKKGKCFRLYQVLQCSGVHLLSIVTAIQSACDEVVGIHTACVNCTRAVPFGSRQHTSPALPSLHNMCVDCGMRTDLCNKHVCTHLKSVAACPRCSLQNNIFIFCDPGCTHPRHVVFAARARGFALASWRAKTTATASVPSPHTRQVPCPCPRGWCDDAAQAGCCTPTRRQGPSCVAC